MKVTIQLNLEVDVDIEGHYRPATLGSFYKSNGDPGDPPEPAEFKIKNVKWQGVDITEMLDKEDFDFGFLEDKCIEKIEE